MPDEAAAALAELTPVIARQILSMPALSDPTWDTYACVADVTDYSVTLTANVYPGTGRPIPVEPPDSYPFLVLRQRTPGPDGRAWDVAIVKILRVTAQLVVNFVSGDGADLWRVIPANMPGLPERMRPRPEDFMPV